MPDPLERIEAALRIADRDTIVFREAWAAVEELRQSSRWETGFRNIVTIVASPRVEFEIPDIVETVRGIVAERDQLRARVASATEVIITILASVPSVLASGEKSKPDPEGVIQSSKSRTPTASEPTVPKPKNPEVDPNV